MFDVPLKPLTVDEGEKMSLRCHVCGSAPLTIQWMKDRKELTSGGNTRISFSDGTACLEISPASRKDAGDYLCKATNEAGSEFCKAKVAVTRKNRSLELSLFRFLKIKTRFDSDHANFHDGGSDGATLCLRIVLMSL